jgi:hypothetical protein
MQNQKPNHGCLPQAGENPAAETPIAKANASRQVNSGPKPADAHACQRVEESGSEAIRKAIAHLSAARSHFRNSATRECA